MCISCVRATSQSQTKENSALSVCITHMKDVYQMGYLRALSAPEILKGLISNNNLKSTAK